MEMTIEEKDNPYMERKELTVKIEHSKETTPAKAALQQEIAKKVGKDIEHVEIVNIFSETGMASSTSKVFVWTTKKVDDLSKKKEEKKEGDTPEPAKETSKEDVKEEKPAEETKPEEKKETPKEEEPKKESNYTKEVKEEPKKEEKKE